MPLSEGEDGFWPKGALCTRSKFILPPRLITGLLLTLLLVRCLWALAHTHVWAQAPGMAAALALGGCLWWVAHRQVGVAGAVFALALYVSLPQPLGWAQVSALGLFAMLYTAVGVAHALQGPRRKWPPRIALMTAVTAFTGFVEPIACLAGLVLAVAVTLYLAEQRRRILLGCMALWGGIAALMAYLGRFLLPFGWSAIGSAPEVECMIGFLAACAAALGLWAVARRSRYFGNSAPLIGAAALVCLLPLVGARVLGWALPFALLFVAGIFADGFESRRARRLWVGMAVALLLVQIGAGLRSVNSKLAFTASKPIQRAK